MKQKFLLILRELERRYSHPFAWLPFVKKKLYIFDGICLCKGILERQLGEKYETTSDEWPFFRVILIEEAKKNRGHVDGKLYGGLFWPAGKLKPRLKTIRAMIKRIENL